MKRRESSCAIDSLLVIHVLGIMYWIFVLASVLLAGWLLAVFAFAFAFFFLFVIPQLFGGVAGWAINHFPALFVYCLSCFLHAKRRFAFGKYMTNVNISFAHEVRTKVCWMVCKAGALLLGKVILRGKYQLIYLVRALRFFFWMQNGAHRFVVVVFFLHAV